MPLLGHVRDASGVVAFGVEMLGAQEKGREGAILLGVYAPPAFEE